MCVCAIPLILSDGWSPLRPPSRRKSVHASTESGQFVAVVVSVDERPKYMWGGTVDSPTACEFITNGLLKFEEKRSSASNEFRDRDRETGKSQSWPSEHGSALLSNVCTVTIHISRSHPILTSRTRKKQLNSKKKTPTNKTKKKTQTHET